MPYEYRCTTCELTAPAIERSAWAERGRHRARVHDGLAPDDAIVHRRGVLGWVWLAGCVLAALGTVVAAVVVVRWWRGPTMRRVRATPGWAKAVRVGSGVALAGCVTAMACVTIAR